MVQAGRSWLENRGEGKETEMIGRPQQPFGGNVMETWNHGSMEMETKRGGVKGAMIADQHAPMNRKSSTPFPPLSAAVQFSLICAGIFNYYLVSRARIPEMLLIPRPPRQAATSSPGSTKPGFGSTMRAGRDPIKLSTFGRKNSRRKHCNQPGCLTRRRSEVCKTLSRLHSSSAREGGRPGT